MGATTDRPNMIAAFYAEHGRTVRRLVTRRVHHVSAPVVEDACQNAWLALLRHQDVELGSGTVGWLTTVATREAWRLSSRRDLVVDAEQLAEFADAGCYPLERSIAREQHEQRVADLQRLLPRERRELYLQALGHSYGEIATLTNSTLTAVNRRLSEGRAKLRRLGK
jgi:RNA polymerase sigma factor (sigma-70 family)